MGYQPLEYEVVYNRLENAGFMFLDKEYKTQNTKINVLEIKTGYKYCDTPKNLINQHFYPFSLANVHHDSNFNLWIKNNNFPAILLEIYRTFDNQLKAKLICDKCKLEWDEPIKRIFKGTKCPYCTGVKPSYMNNLLMKYPEVCKEWDFSKNILSPSDYLPTSAKKVWWKCSRCGHEWQAQIGNRTYKMSRCPECTNESFGEFYVKRYLINNNISYIPQYVIPECKFKRPLPFDFAVLDNYDNVLFLIEFDGQYHYLLNPMRKNPESDLLYTQNNDRIKDEYCNNHNIRLLRIPYWESGNIPQILTKELNL